MTDMILKFFGKLFLYWGSTVGTAYCLFIFLGKKWIENKFATKLEEYKSAQNKELEDSRYRINTLFNRVIKIHEKEYEVLPAAWTKLHDAHDYIASLVSPLQEYPDFNRLREVEIRSILKDYEWEDYQIHDLISADDRIKCFKDTIFWQRLSEARSSVKNFL